MLQEASGGADKNVHRSNALTLELVVLASDDQTNVQLQLL